MSITEGAPSEALKFIVDSHAGQKDWSESGMILAMGKMQYPRRSLDPYRSQRNPAADLAILGAIAGQWIRCSSYSNCAPCF